MFALHMCASSEVASASHNYVKSHIKTHVRSFTPVASVDTITYELPLDRHRVSPACVRQATVPG